jgi:hypothetical protein
MFSNRKRDCKPWRACAQRAECRPTLQIVAYPDAAQRERLHAVAAPRKSPSTSSYVSIDNTLPTDVVSPVIPHPSGILARWMARPAGLFFPPTRLEEVWRWVLARALASGLWCGISATAGVAAHDDHDERRRVRVCTHPPGGGHPVNPRGRHLRTFQARRGILDPLCAGLPSQAICACSFRSHVRAPSFVFRFLLLDWDVRLLRPVG